MSTVLTALAGVALFGGLINAQSSSQAGFNQDCNPPPSGEVEVEPGLFATYRCNQIYHQSSWNSQQSPASSPSECAKHCGARTDGALCSWAGGTCWYYHPGATVDSSNAWSVIVDVRKDWNVLKVAYDSCIAARNQCQADLAACQASAGGCTQCHADLAACQAARNSLQTSLTTCLALQSGGGGTVTPPPTGGSTTARTCSNGARTGDIVTVNGVRYKVTCGVSAGPAITNATGNPRASSIEDCTTHCANDGNCKVVHYDSNSGTCRNFRYVVNTSGPGGQQFTRLEKI